MITTQKKIGIVDTVCSPVIRWQMKNVLIVGPSMRMKKDERVVYVGSIKFVVTWDRSVAQVVGWICVIGVVMYNVMNVRAGYVMNV
jgi:hypothetical protein